MNLEKKEIIIKLLRENIMIATGCTEPVAVALCAAKAKEVLGEIPTKVEFHLSKNVIKNAMGVGIPGTGMIGLPIAISLGIVAGESSKGLEVLDNSKHNLDKAKQWMESNPIYIYPKATEEKLYIECRAEAASGDYSRVIISKTHTNFTLIEKDSIVLESNNNPEIKNSAIKEEENKLLFSDILNYAYNTPIEELEWVMETVKLNKATSEEGLNFDYGLGFGKMLLSQSETSIRKRVIARTCAASDARMDGATTPVYSNSGSGNQGITCTLPVYEFGIENGNTNEEIIRALALSHLMSIHIKQFIGRLSALCGIINAAIGAGSGIIYLLKGDERQIGYFIRNMINNITGMLCDGAKPSCTLKISSALNAAFDSIELAMNNKVVDNTDGISEINVDNSIQSLGKIGRYGMDKIDDIILNIMTTKAH